MSEGSKNFGAIKWGAAILAGIGVSLWVSRRRRQCDYSFAGRTVVITGGSRGLGLILARLFASEGAKVALLARGRDALARAEGELMAQGATVMSVVCDLREREQVESAVGAIVDRFGGIDVLVNNAGVIQVGPYEHMTLQDFEEAMAVHFYGPLIATLSVIPHMRRKGEGRIINITSIGGKVAPPHLLPYVASKFALVGLSDGIRAELRKHNIFVTTVCPGLMRTGSPPNARFKGRHKLEYAWFAISDSLPLISVNADRAGRQIVEAGRQGKPSLVISVQARAAILVNHLFPDASANLTALVNRFLPSPDPSGSTQSFSGWESQSQWAPSWLTKLSEAARVQNNEVPDPITPRKS